MDIGRGEETAWCWQQLKERLRIEGDEAGAPVNGLITSSNGKMEWMKLIEMPEKEGQRPNGAMARNIQYTYRETPFQ